MRLIRVVAGVLAVAVVGVLPLAQAAPTCTTKGTEAACGGRIIAPALQTATFLQHGLEYKAVLDAIEAINPDVVEVRPLGEWIGEPELRSYAGRQIYAVRVTNEKADGPKRQVAISLSIHANESAGREGGLRYLEDLVRWSKTEPQRTLYSGSRSFPLSQILDETEIWLSVGNPDGWAQGDIGGGSVYARGNGRGVDLNREFPTIGWTKRSHTPLSEPEAQGWDALVSSLDNLTTATDIHGELTSASNSFADLMYPAGQWTPKRQAQELQFAQHMTATIERKFDEEGVVLQEVFDLAGEMRPMKPADYATAYDIVGYDDSGFMGDYFVTKGAVEIDVENFLSHMVPNNVWIPALEQAHVAAVKGIVESTIVESMITHEVAPTLDLGRVAYVDDPARVTSEDGFGFALQPGEDPRPYDVSRMRYFADLAADAGVPITSIAAADVPTADLARFDSLVVADMTVPADTQGRQVDTSAYRAALDAFAQGGGQLVLTDSAVRLLADIGVFPGSEIKTVKTNAGHVDFGAKNHRWEQDLSGIASQTYYEVPLGCTATSNAPHWGVTQTAWEAAGGKTAGTVRAGSTTMTALGEIARGAGSIAAFGAILPQPTEANPHLFGLADYGVTVAGGQVLHSILSYRRP